MGITHKVQRLVALSLFISFILVSVCSWAHLPAPRETDRYLIGVKRIVVSAQTGFDPGALPLNSKVPAVDYPTIENDVVAYLKNGLPRLQDKISIVTASGSGINPNEVSSEDTVVVSVRIGYRIVKSNKEPLVLGAAYSVVQRQPPTSLVSPRTSGVHAGVARSTIPYPFILTENSKVDMADAIHRSIDNIISWASHTPFEEPSIHNSK